MATFNPRKFTNPDWLNTISPIWLGALLSPWRDYLAERDFVLPSQGTGGIDHAALTRILMTLDGAAPAAMIDALHHVRETSSPEDMECLHVKATARGVRITDDPEVSPADYAIAVWLADPDLVQERHAETIALGQKNFEYFSGGTGQKRAFPEMSDETKLKVQAAFDDWFMMNRRGRGCRLFVFRQPPTVWLLVRHGLPMRREASHHDDGDAGSEFYRPQKHDVLLFDETTDEIGVNAGTKGERGLYLSTFGRILFGDENHFPAAAKYTLAPLIEDGPAALNCADIDGIDEITLIEYRQYWGGRYKESETRRATDVFAALAKRGAEKWMGGEPSAAVFKVTFSDSRKSRRVVIRVPASARYERDEDSVIMERWLRERGFLLKRKAREVAGHADAVAILAGAG